MNDMAAVSVVVPCYRCARTLERAIASVAAQTQRPEEVILVDDASGDETREIMKKLSRQFESGWIKLVFLDENVGAGSARNAGWSIASQPYVAFLDADDAWHFRKIEIQYGYMRALPDVVLCGHGFRLLKQGVLPYWSVGLGHAREVSKWAMLVSNQFVTPSVMIKREVHHRFIERQRYMEDHMLWLRVVCAGDRVVKLPVALAAIYKDPFGVTGLSSRVWLMERSDLGNYRRLYRAGHVNAPQLGVLVAYSLLKYLRRLVIYAGYLRWKK
ncbi:glycosyltransferase family 2 protein [Rhodoferax sp.]|uniref:glycosyltransferase family 2 protein n=1 Tax=Rhodoferax sp. TaxID=50421 RepID=UPI0026111B3E|nr:glycosyltransferase family 2 protein [Rhodoferax sp.]MDD2918625.1 glycosyltransferase family 2 protein [Rhodoferax sp.]